MPFTDLSGYGGKKKQDSPLGSLLTGVEKFLPAYAKAKEDQVKREEDMTDMYVKLRKIGYTKEDAYDRTLKKVGYGMPSGDTAYDEDTIGLQAKKVGLEKAGVELETAKVKAAREKDPRLDKKFDLDLEGKELQNEQRRKKLNEEDEPLMFGSGEKKKVEPTKKGKGPFEWIADKFGLGNEATSEKPKKAIPFDPANPDATLPEEEKAKTAETAKPIKTEEIALPDGITTTSEALKYLTGKGMSRDEAIDWIKKNT